MTEKRFGMFKSKVTGLYVPVDKMKVYNFSGIEEEYDCMRFIKVLNDLEERGTINGKLASKLLEENEQLKQFKEDVFNKIDMHLRMLPTARDEEFNEENGDPSLYSGAIYMLETLKKELEE